MQLIWRKRLAGAGLDCYYQTVVGDNVERLAGVLKCAMERSDVILLSGGLGPTEDDLTKETVAEVCGKNLSVDDHSMERIAEFFAVRDIQPTENNWKQAMVPEGAKVSTMIMEQRRALFWRRRRTVLCCCRAPCGTGSHVRTAGASLSGYTDSRGDLFSDGKALWCAGEPGGGYPEGSDRRTDQSYDSYLCQDGRSTYPCHRFRGRYQGSRKAIKPVVKELKSRFGADIYSTKAETTLEMAVADLLMANDLTVTTAESCTGGMIAARIINVPGVSECYKAGLVTYSNKAKRKFLGVRKSTPTNTVPSAARLPQRWQKEPHC